MKFFLIAGEPSGDQLGAALISGLRQLAPDAQFACIGGPDMQGQGVPSLFPMQELSVMGLWEVIPRYHSLRSRLDQAVEAVLDMAPDALVTIDSPDFCLRVARQVRKRNPAIKTVHYVAPSVWAWRPGRARKMAAYIDHVLALLPFEPRYMQDAGMSCDFVGHPVATAEIASVEQAAEFRAAHDIKPDVPVVLCLPGSRRAEVDRLAARFDEALIRLRDRVPEIRVVLPTVPGVAQMLRDMVRRWPTAPVVVEDAAAKRAAFAAADLALAASGTVSLELAANRVPMVIGYDMAPVSRWIIRMMLRTDTVTLVNLVSETRSIPEFLGKECQPGPLAEALQTVLEDSAARKAQLDAMDLTMERLGKGGEAPGLRAGRSVLGALGCL